MAGSLKPMHSGRGRRRNFRPTSEINVTPLVDVMLVLLIIFMVTAPMLTVGVPVDLPKTHAAQMNDQVEPLIVSIDAQGRSFFQDQESSLEALIEKLTRAAAGNPDTKIYVRGDKNLSYGKIMDVMGTIASAGFSKVSLIAELPQNNATSSKRPSQKP
jgi:biopolymer transport protein TolR